MPKLTSISVKGMSFKPPMPSRTALAVGRRLIGPALRLKYGIGGVDISEEDLARIRQLSNRRVLITPNHPSSAEPALMFYLSQRSELPFYYVCCREIFELCGGLWGRCLQKFGGYSIVRGVADRESFRVTRELMCKPDTKIVLFPEGEVYSQNDVLLPFQSGVIQLMFWALEDLRKQQLEGAILLLPIAVKYRFTGPMEAPISQSLARLEAALSLTPAAGNDTYARLRSIGIAVLSAIERDYGLKPKSDTEDLNGRITAIKEALIRRVSFALAIVERDSGKDSERTLSQRMRSLINALHEVTSDGDPTASIYETRLRAVQRERIQPLLNDLDRLANLIAIRDGYVSALPTPERIVDTLRRLETEVLGRAYCAGSRRCKIRIGYPIDLADYELDYAGDKRGTVRIVTEVLEGAVQALLDEMVAEDRVTLAEQAVGS